MTIYYQGVSNDLPFNSIIPAKSMYPYNIYNTKKMSSDATTHFSYGKIIQNLVK